MILLDEKVADETKNQRSKVNAVGRDFYHVEQTEGVWWIMTPEKEKMFSIGVNNITHGSCKYAPRLGYSPYKTNILKKYGSTSIWAKACVERIKSWGFNTVGSWSSEQTFEQNVPFTVILDIENSAKVILRTYVLDYFSEAFKETAELVVKEQCLKFKENKNLLGYFTDNELGWKPEWGNDESTIDRYWKMSEKSEVKKRMKSILVNQYKSIDNLNLEWGTNFKTFDALEQVDSFDEMSEKVRKARFCMKINGVKNNFVLEHRILCLELWYKTIESLNSKWKTEYASFEEVLKADLTLDRLPQVEQLEHDFSRAVAKKYFEVCDKAIKKYDANHMILGCRFFGIVPKPVLEGMKDHVDIVSFNKYDFEPAMEQYRQIYEITGKPILHTEFSYKAMDSGLPNTIGGGLPLQTQGQRAEHYEYFTKTIAALPYLVGLHWFEHADQPLEGRFDGENCNYGLVNVEDVPWEELTKKMSKVNAQLYGIHEQGVKNL